MNATNPNQPFLSDFLIYRLHNLLSRELACGSFEIDGHVSWFVKNWRYIPPQKTQADFNQAAREEVIAHVGKPLKVEPSTKVVRDQPLPAKWSKCKHWGGSRECENCQRAAHVAGAMMKAEMLYRENDKFVRWFIKVVLTRRCQDVPEQVIDDLDLAVWHRVAKTIDNFKDPGSGPQRRDWLKQAIDWTVADYFRDTMRAKRDSGLEESYEALAPAS